MKARENRIRFIGAEQLHCDVHEIGPTFREVILQDFLEYGYQLCADLGGRGGEYGKYSVSKVGLVGFWYLLALVDIIVRCPSSKDAILQIDDG